MQVAYETDYIENTNFNDIIWGLPEVSFHPFTQKFPIEADILSSTIREESRFTTHTLNLTIKGLHLSI